MRASEKERKSCYIQGILSVINNELLIRSDEGLTGVISLEQDDIFKMLK